MRILHTSDWHLGRSLEGRSRLPEQEQFIDELVEIANREKIHLILAAGDIFDTCNPSADAEGLFYNALERLSGGGKRAIIVIAGNHDSPDRLHAANPLAAKLGISLLGYPGEQLLPGAAAGGVRRVDAGPGWVELAVPGCEETAIVYALPYPSEARLNEVLTESLEEEAQQAAYSDRVGRLFDDADQIFRPDAVNLAVAHIFAFGGVESESERQLGGALVVSPQMLPARAQYTALGHLHRPQQVCNAPQACRYSGSPLVFSFSEADQQKEVVVVDIVPGGPAQARPINLNCGKPLKRWRANNMEEARAWCAESHNLNCWVELEIMADKHIDTAGLVELRKIHPGIITIRPIFPEFALENADARRLSDMPLVDRFTLFFEREKGISPPEELVKFFLEMANQHDSGQEAEAENAARPAGGEVA